jgi:hypothetical protein
MAPSKQRQEDFSCPACGADVPGGAKSCPECGACEKSGWSGDLGADLGIDDEEFDHEKFVEEEFGGPAPRKGSRRWWSLVALIVFIAFVLSILLGWWR